MPAIRRGIPGYAEGNPDTPADPLGRPTPITRLQDVKAGQQAVADAPPTPGMGQVFAGDFAGARDNPESSPATAAVGQVLDYSSRVRRAQNLAGDIASPASRFMNLFFGNQGSTKAIADRDATANAFHDQLMQQYLVSNPDQLAIAEKDPRGYAAVSTDPNFRQTMAQAVGAHVDAAANDKVTHAEHPKVVSGAVDNNVTAAQSHAALAPHKYTEDEFVKLFSGMPMKQVAMLFGQQMGHVRSPQEKAATEVFDVLHGNFAKANDRVKQMEAEIAEATKNKVSSPHTQAGGFGFGTSPYDAAKAERDKAYSVTMDALKSFIGITGKPYPMPGQPGG